MTNLIIKYTPINTVVDTTLFQQKWYITNTTSSEITIINTNYKKSVLTKKKVEFTKQVDICLFDKDNKTKKIFKEDMNKYGNEPTPKQQLFEHYVYNICRLGGLELSKTKFITSLHILQLYYYLMSRLIECFYILSNDQKFFIYTKRTFIVPGNNVFIKNFIEQQTDIIDKLKTIQYYYKNRFREKKTKDNNQ